MDAQAFNSHTLTFLSFIITRVAFFTFIYVLQFLNPCCVRSNVGKMCRPAKFKKSWVIKDCVCGFFFTVLNIFLITNMWTNCNKKKTPSLFFFGSNSLWTVCEDWKMVQLPSGNWWLKNMRRAAGKQVLLYAGSIRWNHVIELNMISWNTVQRLGNKLFGS